MSDYSEIQSNRSSFFRSLSAFSTAEEVADVSKVEYEFYQFQDIPELESSTSSKPGGAARQRYSSAIPVVTCRVCEAKIPLIGYDLEETFIVKCGKCNEATPIKTAPPGEKYVRCVCNCLLVCRKTATTVACPRVNCRRIISVANPEHSSGDLPTAFEPPRGTVRLTCPHCRQPFIFNTLEKSLTKCPYCGRLSAINDAHRRRQLRRTIISAVVFLIMALAMIISNSLLDNGFPGDVTLYVTLLIIAGFQCVKPIVLLTVRNCTGPNY